MLPTSSLDGIHGRLEGLGRLGWFTANHFLPGLSLEEEPPSPSLDSDEMRTIERLRSVGTGPTVGVSTGAGSTWFGEVSM